MKHVVMFKLKGSKEERKALALRFLEALMELLALIPELKSMETGLNVNPAEDWDVVLIAGCDKFEDIARYAVHPAHQAALNMIRPYIEMRACVDYEG